MTPKREADLLSRLGTNYLGLNRADRLRIAEVGFIAWLDELARRKEVGDGLRRPAGGPAQLQRRGRKTHPSQHTQ